ncbi:MAG TPA: energy transducer TonB [Candidatus Polarisedimenticolaceae bacterium]
MQQLHLTGPEPLENEETAALRRIFRMQLAVLLSVIAHLLIVIGILVMPDWKQQTLAQVQPASPEVAASPPVVFMSPRPPAPPPSSPAPAPAPAPKAPAEEMRLRKETPPPVDPPRDARYRMEPNRRIPEGPPPETPKVSRSSGMEDSRPKGGARGGPLPDPAPGVPDREEAGRTSIAPRDLAGRIRSFQQALPKPDLAPSNKGPKGGGKGEGGPLDLSSLPFVGYGVGNLQFESVDYDWGDYGRAIYIAIWRAWHNRLWMTSGVFERWAAENQSWALDHRNVVRFTITKDGQVVGVSIETESGCYPLDDSAADALREVVLPPLPADFPRGQETVRAMFIAEGEIKQMRRSLQYLKDRGYF